MNLQVDLLVLDEAQKVGDYNRDIITEDGVQELIHIDSSMQKVFILLIQIILRNFNLSLLNYKSRIS